MGATSSHVPPRSRPFSARWAPSLYFVVGQAAWFACVMSAARGAQGIGIGFVIVLLGLHLAWVARPIEELKLLVSVAVIGAAWDSALVSLCLLAYPHSASIHGLAPWWLPALWASFAGQFNTTYQWLKTRPQLAVLLGAVAGPLSFRAGAALSAVQFVKPWPAVMALALGWAVLLPTITLLSRRWDGVKLDGLPAPRHECDEGLP